MAALWTLYVLRCRDKTLYCGITNNMQRRLKAHNEGKGAKYTRPGTRRPILFVAYAANFPDRSSASKAEYAFKQLSKAAKEKFIRSPR
jgi:putative endonuclease